MNARCDPGPELTAGLKCECGHFEKFPMYVYAHWGIPLTFTCSECGARYEVLRGACERIDR